MRTVTDIALLLNRIGLGLYFAAAGFGKVQIELSEELGAFARGSFAGLAPTWLPGWFATPYGYALPWLEVIAGVNLILGLAGRVQAGAIALMLLSFQIALILGTPFGWRPKDWSGWFHPNFIFLTLAILLAATGPGRLSLDHMIVGRRRAKKDSE